MNLGPPKRDTAPPAEKWVPCDTPHMYRDANSHPDPAYQRRKYMPPTPQAEWIPTYFYP